MATSLQMLKEKLKEPSRKPSLTCATPPTTLPAGGVYKPPRETLLSSRTWEYRHFYPNLCTVTVKK